MNHFCLYGQQCPHQNRRKRTAFIWAPAVMTILCIEGAAIALAYAGVEVLEILSR